MKIGVLPVGQIAPEVLERVAQGLTRIFPDTSACVLEEPLLLPSLALDKKRSQYNSTIILKQMQTYAKKSPFKPILGIINVDLFSSGLNYIFGEAYTPGKVALISLWRLRPQFYGADADLSLYSMRTLKEALHEVGHTLGLPHCPRSYCVMHFSNSIFDTDKKQSLLCDQCYMQAALAISNQGSKT